MQPITIITTLIFFGVLFLRYKSQGPNAKRSTNKQKFKLGKLLLSGLLALMAVGFALRRLGHNMDGDNPDPSFMEQVVQYFSK